MSTHKLAHLPPLAPASTSPAAAREEGLDDTGACVECGHSLPPEPLTQARAAALRAQCRLLFGSDEGDRLAYQYARAAIPFGSDQAACTCKLRCWFEAGDEYLDAGSEACWRALGVTKLVTERAEMDRLLQASRERELSPREATELLQLQAALARN